MAFISRIITLFGLVLLAHAYGHLPNSTPNIPTHQQSLFPFLSALTITEKRNVY
jgi:hypothetical protein